MSVLQRRRRIATTLAVAAGAVAALPASALAVPQTNACKNSATANNSQINLDTSGTAPATTSPGSSVTLSNIQQSGAIPGAIFVAGYNLGLLTTGTNNIPTAVYSVIHGDNTVEGNKQTNTVNTVITTVVTDPDGNPGTGDELATDATFSVMYNDLTFTAGPSGVINFRQANISPPNAGTKTGSFIAVASLAGGFIKVTFACTPGTVTPPDPGTPTYTDGAPFASTTIVSAPSNLVTGNGTTNPPNGKPSNQFTIAAPDSSSGTVTYTGSTRNYSGSIICVNVVGNAAYIVSEDSANHVLNTTQVQDNGSSGDKLINSNLNEEKATAKQLQKAKMCGTPNVAKLNAANPLAGDAIQISTPI